MRLRAGAFDHQGDRLGLGVRRGILSTIKAYMARLSVPLLTDDLTGFRQLCGALFVILGDLAIATTGTRGAGGKRVT